MQKNYPTLCIPTAYIFNFEDLFAFFHGAQTKSAAHTAPCLMVVWDSLPQD
jgi:hypothetical protein